jgi:hypothetical protein
VHFGAQHRDLQPLRVAVVEQLVGLVAEGQRLLEVAEGLQRELGGVEQRVEIVRVGLERALEQVHRLFGITLGGDDRPEQGVALRAVAVELQNMVRREPGPHRVAAAEQIPAPVEGAR